MSDQDFFATDSEGSDNESPNSPEIPLQSRGGLELRGSNSRGPPGGSSRRRVRLTYSGNEPECSSQTTPSRQNAGEVNGAGQSVLMELKQMLSKVCKQVEQNERVLKELQEKNSGSSM